MARTNSTHLYITPETRVSIDRLLLMLARQGVDLKDNRGNLSMSALLRYLVEAELRRQTADPDAPFPEVDPWDELGVYRTLSSNKEK